MVLYLEDCGHSVLLYRKLALVLSGVGQCFASIAVHRGTTIAECSCIPLAAVGGPAKFFVGTVVQCGIPVPHVSGLSSQAGHICCRTTTVQLSLRCEWLVRACYGLGVVTGLVVSLCTVEAFLL